MHELAHWGARSLGPPLVEGSLEAGWLAGALRIALPPTIPSIEFRIGGEIAHVAEGDSFAGPAEEPAAIVEGDVASFYDLLVNRQLDTVTVHGSKAVVDDLLAALPARTPDLPAPRLAAAS
jgi:hypothetical protein